MDDEATARLAAEVADPSHPFTAAAMGRVATFDREATTASGGSFVGAYLPLVVSSGGVDVTLGSFGMGWPAPRPLDDAERDTISALAGALRRSRWTARDSPRRPPNVPSGSSGWPTRIR